MSTEIKLKQLENAEQNYKAAIRIGAALERLKRNKDYQLVIEQGYLTDNAVRLVHLKGDPSQNKPEQQAAILKEIDAISSFQEYQRFIRREHDTALVYLPTIDDQRAQVIEEGAE